MEHLTNTKRKNIGILINQVYGWYQTPICKGIKKVAKERNVNLLFFSGMSLKSKWKDEIQQNIIYKIVNTYKLDGLIIASGVLSSFIGLDEFIKFIEPYRNIPSVSISAVIPEMPSVIFDNKASMNLVLEHIINHHHYSNIAFISGPLSNAEAILRYEAYIDFLKKYNIPFNKDYFFEGDFGRGSGSKAIDVIFTEKKLRPNVIVCSSDEMAIGAHNKLTELGIKVPGDTALIGFDDLESVRFFSPPFTSVKQPTFEMSSRALELLCDTIDGKTVPLVTSLKGKLMIRQSCGCMNMLKKIPSSFNAAFVNYDSFDKACSAFIQRLNLHIDFDAIIPSFNLSEFDIKNYKKNVQTLIKGLINDIKAKNLKSDFLDSLNSILSSSFLKDQNYYLWKEIIFNLRNCMLKIIDDVEILYTVENIFYIANDLISDTVPRNELFNAYNIDKTYIDINYITKIINSTMNLDDLITVLKKDIKLLGVNQCYLCLYEAPIKNVPSLTSDSNIFDSKIKMVLGYNNLTFAKPQTFNIKEMLPDRYICQEERNELVFLPLFVDSDHFGYVVFDMNPIAEFILETLRESISNALKTHTLFSERQKAEEQLRLAVAKLEIVNKELQDLSVNDELTGLYNRRGFFTNAEKYYKTAVATNENFILFFGDLDGLKQINDNYGHAEGDEAICAISQILKKSFRDHDIVARLGGDEFVIMATNASSEETLNALRNRIDDNIEQYNESSNKQYKLSLSLGYVIYSGEPNINFQDLIKLADDKLYQKKHKRKSLRQSKN